MSKELWWKKPLRVIQTNLQIKDTGKMDPEKIAQDIFDMGGNVLVMNVGGIYGWYPSENPYHTANPYLPKDTDLLEDLINACHKRNIRLVARYDFSKCSDRIYQLKPTWFSRNVDHTPQPIGLSRPGEWDLLYQTCINSDYRNVVAPEIIHESLSKYDIDGVFLNAPHPTNCHCDHCKEKYFKLYGEELPEKESEWRKDYKSICLRDQVKKINDAVKAEKPDAPLILYYSIASDNLYDRIATCDLICAEPQDVLSLGWKEIPQSFKPALCISLGRSEKTMPKPFGIIHSCPGMEWRHTGLPSAEYMYWMSQVPANGGQIWHSITGFSDTISDKRILKCVSDINHQIIKTEDVMDEAKSNAKVAILWNMDCDSMEKTFAGELNAPANGYAKSLLDAQIPFDVILPEQLEKGALDAYKLLILPDSIREELKNLVEAFVNAGGTVLSECAHKVSTFEADFMGIHEDSLQSEFLESSYFRFEKEGDVIRSGFEVTPLIPYRGKMMYVEPKEDTKVFGTLVPMFAPKEAVGAPPERASMNVSQTDIPLLLERTLGKGKICSFPFAISALISELKLEEHERLIANIAFYLLGEEMDLHTDRIRGIQLVDYMSKQGERVLHIVNGIGERPLSNNIPVPVTVTVDLKDKKAPEVKALLGDTPSVKVEGNQLIITTSPVKTWEVLVLK